MYIIDKVIETVESFSGFTGVDVYTDYTPSDDEDNSYIAPSGLSVKSVKGDILSGVDVTYTYNCNLFLRKSFSSGLTGLDNQKILEDFQFWLMAKNFDGSLPQLGVDKLSEFWYVTVGSLVELSANNDYALYLIKLSIEFMKEFRR